MGIHAALHHLTEYRYDRDVRLGPQIIRLRPAAHSRTKVLSYSLKVSPEPHFLNWLQDPYGNFLARVVFPDYVRNFRVEVDLVADLAVYNPFDFFLEPSAETWPFTLSSELANDLAPYRVSDKTGPVYRVFDEGLDRSAGRRTIDVLVDLNRRVQNAVTYTVRMEPNVQTPDDTLIKASGSCRDSAVLLVEVLRSFGFAARFVSGYLLQLVPDRKPLEGPAGPSEDFTDLHAWAEAYVPGAGWIGLDPTSGLLAGEGHIPLAATPRPGGASPVQGTVDPSEVSFRHEMRLTRLESPRPLRPWAGSVETRQQLDTVGRGVDARLEALGYRLTMGAEPTFVSETDRNGAEWGPDALGPTKKSKAWDLLRGLRQRWAPGAVVHTAQGKWYPGESLPRWALSCFWRADGQPVWKDERLLADESKDYGFTDADARDFLETLCEVLGVDKNYIIPAYEDPFHFLQLERQLPVNIEPGDPRLADTESRVRLVEALDRGLDKPSGLVLPLQKGSWKSGPWPLRGDRLVLMPGDSPIGLRLPLESLPWAREDERDAWFPADPQGRVYGAFPQPRRSSVPAPAPEQAVSAQPLPELNPPAVPGTDAFLVRTALCVQQRHGVLYVFFPPMRTAEDWFALVTEIEETSRRLNKPVVLEGYQPAYDPRLGSLQITPDPGVIEVNLPPSATWDEWSSRWDDLYAEAAEAGLSTEKYLIGGQVVGSGGGCHWVMGGVTPADSPFLKRPDLLRSWVAWLNHHPSLSYLFAGLFIGATSQAPRPDEALPHHLQDLELAFAEVDRLGPVLPWMTDRIFRNLLTDGTGNTHRTELCIDKLFSPDSASGRRGLVEFRGFEMAPHVDLALSQSLLLRALTVAFLEEPYTEMPQRWGTALGDRWMLPEFLLADFDEVLSFLDSRGLGLPRAPFTAHAEFRFPVLGTFVWDGMEIELRQALEPWPVLGEEAGSGGTVRYVDSSVERLQVKVRNWNPARYALACRGRQLPLQPGREPGSVVAGVRFKAWNLPSGLHPTVPEDGTVVVDVLDLWSHRVVAGCTFHVAHPAGRSYDEPPVNAFEAEARRSARFELGHTPGQLERLPVLVPDAEFPHTLDLRGVR